jgi:NAD(P)-dependent dehydrogenase (short-subunit alcohol dehydrogenase family)
MDLRLKGHVAVVTGAASGIGRATANNFAAEGAHTVLWDVAEEVRQVAAEIGERFSVRTLALRVDVSDEAAVRGAAARTIEELGSLDHVVHAAAVGSGKYGFPYTNLGPRDWRRPLEVNVLGMVHVAHAVADHFVAQRRGTLVFIASVAGQIGSQTDPPYSASKAANINFAQCMAKDLAPHGVRVNTVCPGMVQTPLNRQVWKAWHDQQPPAARRSYEDWAGEKVKRLVPLARWQAPEDVADMIVFLSSDRAAHVTGQTINVDGGFVMHW